MRVILQGSVRHFGAGELMALLSGSSHTGTFDAESGEKRLRLFIREGRIAWAEGGSGADAHAIVTDFVTWTDGTFTFLDALELPEGIRPLRLDPVEVVAAAERRISETKRVLEMYPDEQTVFRVVPNPQGDQISLRSTDLQVLLAIGTLTTVEGMMHPLLEDASLIGRVSGNAVVLPDSSVSSRHARVTRSAEGFFLEDLGSRNGTYVNGDRITDKTLLADGDTIRFGKLLLTFNIAAETRPKDSTQPEVLVPRREK